MKPDPRTSLRVWLRLLTCTNLIEGRVRAQLRQKFGSTLPRFDMLAQLDVAAAESDKGLTMGELSRRLMVTNANITGLAERLVREKLIVRIVGPQDRRVLRLRLTAAGKRTLDSMALEHQRWIEDMFSGLSSAETAQLHRLIGRLKESVLEASS